MRASSGEKSPLLRSGGSAREARLEDSEQGQEHGAAARLPAKGGWHGGRTSRSRAPSRVARAATLAGHLLPDNGAGVVDRQGVGQPPCQASTVAGASPPQAGRRMPQSQ